MSILKNIHWGVLAGVLCVAAVLGATEIYGTITNDAAPAGCVGEMLQSIVPASGAVTMTSGTPSNIASITLTPGDWNVCGNVNFSSITATGTGKSAGISLVSASVPNDGTEGYSGLQLLLLSVTDGVCLMNKPVRVAAGSSATVYLVASATFTLGTMKAFGSITARRAR